MELSERCLVGDSLLFSDLYLGVSWLRTAIRRRAHHPSVDSHSRPTILLQFHVQHTLLSDQFSTYGSIESSQTRLSASD